MKPRCLCPAVVLAQPTCPYPTMHFPGTQHIPVAGCFTILKPTYSLPSSWFCFHSFFHPSKSWLSSSPKSNAMPSRNKAFSDFPCQHWPPHLPATFWFFFYFGTWDHLLCISFMFTRLSPSLDRGFLKHQAGPPRCTSPGQTRQHCSLCQGLANIFCKGPHSILGFPDRMVSVTTTQLCHFTVKAAVDNI